MLHQSGSQNVVYFDESGFASHNGRLDGWAVKGTREKKTNLLMALRGKEHLAPLVFQDSCTVQLVTDWAEKMLLQCLDKPSLIIMDNALVHNKKRLRSLLKKHGHGLLPLPPYSPDLNPIEQVFGSMKKRCQAMTSDTTIEEIIISYS